MNNSANLHAQDEVLAHRQQMVAIRRAAWDKSPIRKFVTGGLYLVFAANLAIWSYYLFPFDTSNGQGVCEAAVSTDYAVPAPSAAATPSPNAVVTAPATSSPSPPPGVSAKATTPQLQKQTRTSTCRQPVPSNVLIVAAVVLGLFFIPELLVTFGSFRLNTPAGNFSAGVDVSDEYDYTHNKAVEAYEQYQKGSGTEP